MDGLLFHCGKPGSQGLALGPGEVFNGVITSDDHSACSFYHKNGIDMDLMEIIPIIVSSILSKAAADQ